MLGTSTNPDVLTSEHVLSARCLVLLGEPGMGKSYAARHLAEAERTAGPPVVEFNLGRLTTEALLERGAFESEQVRAWRGTDAELCLYLDSFDEAATQFTALPDLFMHYVENWPIDRLKLRVVCRSAEWPLSTSRFLERLFEESMSSVELLPLRRIDAKALIASPRAEQLLTAIEEAGLVPLAARPLTLRLIARGFDPDVGLPQRPAEIYERGLLTLCEEANDERRQRQNTHELTPWQTLRHAAEVAAVSVMAGKGSIWTGSVAGETAGHVTESDLAAIQASAGDHSEVAGAVFRRLTRTGLLTRLSADSFGWAHATFTNFLAARWIHSSGLSNKQVASLLTSSDGRVFPQLGHIAGWLVALAPRDYRWLVEADPESFLLGTDIPDESLREAAVNAILGLARQGKLFHDYNRQLGGLAHSRLPEQLAEALLDQDAEVRRIAIDITRACVVTRVAPELIEIAIDTEKTASERTSAIMTADQIQGEPRTLDFSAILTEQIDGELERSELVGAALLASWPQSVSAAEAFSALSFRPPKNLVGLHSSFVHQFAHGLALDDLEPGISWLQTIEDEAGNDWKRPLADAVTFLALTNPSHRSAHQYALRRARELLQNYEPIFANSSERRLDDECRQLIALELLCDEGDELAFAIVSIGGNRDRGILDTGDFGWLIWAFGPTSGVLRSNLQRVIRFLFNVNIPSHIDALLALPPEHDVIVEVLDYWFNSVAIDSEQARRERERWSRVTSHSDRDGAETANNDAEVNERIANLAAQACSGDSQAFWVGCRLITVPPRSQYYSDEWKADLSEHPRWMELPSETQQLVIRGSARYLAEGSCEPGEWVGKNLNYYPAVAGFRALVLLHRFEPERLSELSAKAWLEWAPIIVTWTAYDPETRAIKRRLIAFAAPYAADEMRSVLLATARASWTKNETARLNDEFDQLWQSGLDNELYGDLTTLQNRVAREEVLDILLSQSSARAKEYLLAALTVEAREGKPDDARRAGARLLRDNADAAWPALRILLSEDAVFMESVVLEAEMDRSPPKLGESELAELYLWLDDRFPRSEDPSIDSAHSLGRREQLGRWRDSILREISNRGTGEAVVAIRKIMSLKPSDRWLGRLLVTAENAFRHSNWRPLDVTAIGALAASSKTRIIRDATDLANAVVDAFDEIQDGLQGDTPDSASLWDTRSREPKNEDEISDYLRNRLNDRLTGSGVVVNREVQIRRITGIGERTDLRVDALADGIDHRTISIVGEVKGCWYPNLIEPVTDQLVDRYMSRVGTSEGLFIVVWFDQDSWNQSDRRRRAAGPRTPDSIDAALEPILSELLERGIAIRVIHLDASR